MGKGKRGRLWIVGCLTLGVFALGAGCHGHYGFRRAVGKSTVCHKGKTLHVDDSARGAHLGHGDRPGPC